MGELLEKYVAGSTANVTVSTTTETVLAVSDAVTVPVHTCVVHIRAWAQVTSGVAATSLTARIRQGSGITGPVVGEANLVTLAAAAGGNEAVIIEAVERRSNISAVQYSFTVQQTDASGDAMGLQSLIEVEVLTG